MFFSIAILSSYLIRKSLEFKCQIVCSVYLRKVLKNRLDRLRIRTLLFTWMLKTCFLVTGVFCLVFAVYVSQRDVTDEDNYFFCGLNVDLVESDTITRHWN